MALKNKTLLNDVGSAVVAETVSQLNRASCSTGVAYVTNNVGIGAGIGDIDFKQAETIDSVIFSPAEACLVTSVKLMSQSVVLDGGTKANSALVLLNVPSTWTDAAGTANRDQIILGTTGVHGDAAGGELGAGDSTYGLVGATDATVLTAEIGEWFELLGLTSAGTVEADRFASTNIAKACKDTPAVNFEKAITMEAGSSLVLGVGLVNDATAADTQLLVSITYRPIKDELSLKPAFTPAMANFSSTDR